MNHIKNILIVGELVKDKFIYGSCKRLCPEGPVPVFNPIKTITNDGCAGNVKNNLISLSKPGSINTFFFHQTPEITKTRYIDEETNQLLLRVDENDFVHYLQNAESKFDTYFNKNLRGKQIDYIVFSEYGKGFLNEQSIIKVINRVILNQKTRPIIFLDTKLMLGEWSQTIDFVKINKKEYDTNKLNQYFIDPKNPGFCKNLIVTMGKNGISYNDNIFVMPEKREDVFCVSGAGDSCLAALVVFYQEHEKLFHKLPLSKELVDKLLHFMLKVGSAAISKRGVVSVKREEIK